MTTTASTAPLAATSARGRIKAVTGAVWVLAGALAATGQPRVAAAGGAFAIGWSHLVGRCGVSHLGTLTPLGKLAGQRRHWLGHTVVYTASGLLASTVVGAGLGTVGSLPVLDDIREAALGAVVILGVVAMAGDLGLVGWRLPQPNRQTRQEWAYTFRRPVAAALWGFGLGLTFATVFTFSGVWLVLALPVVVGEVGFGVTLLAAHWLGRALSVLAGPILLRNAAVTTELLDEIEESRTVFLATNIAGVVLIGAAAVGLLLGGL